MKKKVRLYKPKKSKVRVSTITYDNGGTVKPPPATRSDSLAVMNNAIELDNFYKDYDLTNDSPDRAEQWFEELRVARDIFNSEPPTRTTETGRRAVGFDEYYQHIDENVFKQREMANSIMNMSAPMGFYDRRIKPQSLRTYTDNTGVGVINDHVAIPRYDPLAVTPWDMLSESQRKERVSKFGTSGTPFAKPKGTLDPKKSINVNLMKSGYATDTKSATAFKKKLWEEVYPNEPYVSSGKKSAAQNNKLNSWIFDNEDKLAEFNESGTVESYREKIAQAQEPDEIYGEHSFRTGNRVVNGVLTSNEPMSLPTRPLENIDTRINASRNLIEVPTPNETRRYDAESGRWTEGNDNRSDAEVSRDKARWEWAQQNQNTQNKRLGLYDSGVQEQKYGGMFSYSDGGKEQRIAEVTATPSEQQNNNNRWIPEGGMDRATSNGIGMIVDAYNYDKGTKEAVDRKNFNSKEGFTREDAYNLINKDPQLYGAIVDKMNSKYGTVKGISESDFGRMSPDAQIVPTTGVDALDWVDGNIIDPILNAGRSLIDNPGQVVDIADAYKAWMADTPEGSLSELKEFYGAANRGVDAAGNLLKITPDVGKSVILGKKGYSKLFSTSSSNKYVDKLFKKSSINKTGN
jgi:hypothetical protein